MRVLSLSLALTVALGAAFELVANSAEPPIKPEAPAATTEVAWSAAMVSNTPAAWDAAASAYERELVTCNKQCVRDAYRVVLARREAMERDWTDAPAGTAPARLPVRVQATVAAINVYSTLAPATPNALRSELVKTQLLAAYRQPVNTQFRFLQVATR